MVKKRKKKSPKKRKRPAKRSKKAKSKKRSKKGTSKGKKTTKKKRKAKRKPIKKTASKKQKKYPNHRKFARIPIRFKIDYFKDPGVFLYDYSRNLGRGGLFIETDQPMEPGTKIHLNFVLPDQSNPIEVEGMVRWVHKAAPGVRLSGVPGMGVQFHNPEGENKEALDRFFREIDYDNLTF